MKLNFQNKISLLLTGLALLFMANACDDDDVCLDPTTPRLTLVVYNESGQTKTSDSIMVERLNADQTVLDTVFTLSLTDSIQIPLNLTASQTLYRFNRLIDGTYYSNLVTIDQTTEQKYISKACGFKVIYPSFQTNIETSTSGITNFTQDTNEITDESLTNISLFYHF